MKEMEIKNKAQMLMALQEAEMLKDIMEKISHPNIMQIEKVFQVGSKFYLVFPFLPPGCFLTYGFQDYLLGISLFFQYAQGFSMFF